MHSPPQTTPAHIQEGPLIMLEWPNPTGVGAGQHVLPSPAMARCTTSLRLYIHPFDTIWHLFH